MHARAFGFTSGALRLSGEVVLPERPRLLTVLCHGIPSGEPPEPEDPGYSGFARDLAGRGFGSAWFNFRAAKGMPGEFSIAGWVEDLEAALDALARDAQCASLPQVAVGSSAGGSVAIVAAARIPVVRAVAALAAPASFTAAAADTAKVLGRLRNAGLIRDPAWPPDVAAWQREFTELAAERHVAAVAPRPLLVVHGDADDVVPYPHAEALFACAGEPKEIVRIPGGGHRLRTDERAIEALADWLDRLTV